MHLFFCAIVGGDTPCIKVHEDDLTITFLDIFPVARGHTLIVTKEHYVDIFSVAPEALSRVAANSIRMASAIDSALAPDGLSVVQLNRAAAGQTVFHYHMHLIPRISRATSWRSIRASEATRRAGGRRQAAAGRARALLNVPMSTFRLDLRQRTLDERNRARGRRWSFCSARRRGSASSCPSSPSRRAR